MFRQPAGLTSMWGVAKYKYDIWQGKKNLMSTTFYLCLEMEQQFNKNLSMEQQFNSQYHKSASKIYIGLQNGA